MSKDQKNDQKASESNGSFAQNTQNENSSTSSAVPSTLPFINNAHYIKDLSFENPGVLKSLTKPGINPTININIQVNVQTMDKNVFEVVLITEVKSLQDDQPLFLLDLTYGGIFTIQENLEQDYLKPLLLIECPRLLFPFARRLVADLTRDGGLPPLMLNTIDFEHLYHQQENGVPINNKSMSHH